MTTLQSKLFLGVRALYILLVLVLMGGIPGASKTLIGSLGQAAVGIGIAIFIAVNYEKGKNWARIWMLIALVLSVILYIKDISDFSQFLAIPDFSQFGVLGIGVDITCIIGSIISISLISKTGKIPEEGLAAENHTSSDPESNESQEINPG